MDRFDKVVLFLAVCLGLNALCGYQSVMDETVALAFLALVVIVRKVILRVSSSR